MKNNLSNKEIQYVLNTLHNNNFSAYIIGGSIRNYLLKKNIDDIDIATNASTEEITRLFKQQCINAKAAKYASLILNINNKKFEITSFRIESHYKDYRHPSKIVFTNSLKKDLMRRDFTINALAFDGKRIFDYVNGLVDIRNKIIRCIGNPDLKFSQDPLRMLRAIRFCCEYDLKIEKKTQLSLFKNFSLINYLIKSKAFQEIYKMLEGHYFYAILERYESLFKIILPFLNFDDKIIRLLKYKNKKYNNFQSKLLLLIIYTAYNLDTYDINEKTINKASDYLNLYNCPKHLKKHILNVLACFSLLSIDSELEKIRKIILKNGYFAIYNFIDILMDIAIIADNNTLTKKLLILTSYIKKFENGLLPLKLADLDINTNDILKVIGRKNLLEQCLEKVFFAILNQKIKNDTEEILCYIKSQYNKN